MDVATPRNKKDIGRDAPEKVAGEKRPLPEASQ
jgi:hypothetical protein